MHRSRKHFHLIAALISRRESIGRENKPEPLSKEGTRKKNITWKGDVVGLNEVGSIWSEGSKERLCHTKLVEAKTEIEAVNVPREGSDGSLDARGV